VKLLKYCFHASIEAKKAILAGLRENKNFDDQSVECSAAYDNLMGVIGDLAQECKVP